MVSYHFANLTSLLSTPPVSCGAVLRWGARVRIKQRFRSDTATWVNRCSSSLFWLSPPVMRARVHQAAWRSERGLNSSRFWHKKNWLTQACKTWPYIFVNKVLPKHSPPTCLHLAYGCFCPATAASKSCDRGVGAWRTLTICRKTQLVLAY